MRRKSLDSGQGVVLCEGELGNSLRFLANLRMVSMESKSTKKGSEKAHSREATSDDVGLRLDDLEHEIIDLVEVVEEGASSSGVAPAEELEAADGLVGDDLEFEGEVSREVEASMPQALEEEMREADEALGEAEDEFESLLRAESTEPEAGLEDLSQKSDGFGEEETGRELTDLLSSDELEVSKLLEDGPAEGGKSPQPFKEESSAPDEEFFEGLFDDLEEEEEGAETVAASSESGATWTCASSAAVSRAGAICVRASIVSALPPRSPPPASRILPTGDSARPVPGLHHLTPPAGSALRLPVVTRTG